MPMTAAAPPSPSRVIATVGLHGSASTWVFNVVRETMMIALGEDQVRSFYAETRDEVQAHLVPGRQCAVIKSHHGSADLDAWLAAAGAEIFLSLRDPRDAALSMAQRFKVPLKTAVGWVAADCRRLAALGERFPLLRYEDRFFEHRATVEDLAGRLNVPLDATEIDGIFARYSTSAVRSFAETLADKEHDSVTQIHRGHIGDARSGKWRGLPAQVQAELTRFFAPFLKRHGYS
jgi:hypothetical protein